MEWRARITDRFGRVLGSGTLIDKRRVLTAAHVVFEEPDICVSFPGTAEDVSATVEVQGAWCELGDSEDFSVLKLSQPAPVEPCRLADPRGWGSKGSRKLAVLGFPTGHEQHGRLVELRAEETNWIANEWLQVNVSEGHVPALARGFSGAGVYDPGSGEVVGILTDADLDRDYLGAIGRMLPLARLRRYWEPLDDLLPLTWLTPESRHRLRPLLSEARVAISLERVLHSTIPNVNDSPKFRSPWDLVRYVGEQIISEDALPRVLSALRSAGIDHTARHEVTRCLETVFPHFRPEPAEPRRPSIMVRVETRTKGEYEVMFSILEGDMVRPVKGPIQVEPKQLRREIEKHLPQVIAEAAVVGDDWMIEFVVPENLLGEPFDDYVIREEDADISWSQPIGLMPVVVGHIDRLRPGLMSSQMARRRWRQAPEGGMGSMMRIPCQVDRNRNQYLHRFSADPTLGALLCAVNMPKSALSAALSSGVSTMFWRRMRCRDDSHVDCDRLMDVLEARLDGKSRDSWPDEVRLMRNEAKGRADGTRHCGWKLTMFWDNPVRGQDPPLGMEGQQRG